MRTWTERVTEGSRLQTLRRLELHNKIASAHRKERFAQEFKLAIAEQSKQFEQRQMKLREENKNKKEYDKFLTLEDYAKLYVINLGSWKAFTFWREVRARHVFSLNSPCKKTPPMKEATG